ncbi:hypothetical protein GJ496_005379 [Pomphorhynchus laevis]|nr:hypothetical protein GJ496_005379 [Pomphorhynchus laevis]
MSSATNNTDDAEMEHSKTNFFSTLQYSLADNVLTLYQDNLVKHLLTVLRSDETERAHFKFCADRLIRLVVEQGLNQLNYVPKTIITPTGGEYYGLDWVRGHCGISILPAGEAMEKGLRDCCRSIRIGKILMEGDSSCESAIKLIYAKLPSDVSKRRVLLLYPIIVSGWIVSNATDVFREYGICDENVLLLNLFATPDGIKRVTTTFPRMKLVCAEIHPTAPIHFSKMYFGFE